MLVTDFYFSLLHYAYAEETVTDDEWKYFLECLDGDVVYSLDDKLYITGTNSGNQCKYPPFVTLKQLNKTTKREFGYFLF